VTPSSLRIPRKRVLVVEDDYYVADSLALALEAHGIEVLGPVATVQAASDLIAQTERIEGAVLDVNLKGESVYPVADELRRNRVPFVFTTGYDAASVAKREPDVVCLEKPVSITQLIHALFD
jgi:DNA-binding response OmpR family regulator